MRIRDNGIGIPPELLPRIFELFVQNDRALDRSEGGLGIGLSVVQRLVEMHDGSVAAFSAGPGHGSTFEIRLPAIDPPAPAAEGTRRANAILRRVLVVDDSIDAATSLALLLAIDGHSTESVYTAHDAIERAPAFRPDVVLLDIGLPAMNGYDVARRLRTIPSLEGVRLVAITGYGQPEDRRRAREAGFDAHLVKPVDYVALASVLAADAAPA